ncbi:hypothetical protein LSTR_LSTR013373 [Laodelphax striatellus]|uniref:Odorant receptor n=1 Tax=Laodelphax striatellus TaxID=195883 RepID=A0A482XV48_LAOST|nr:hypothetical protein LSTR_LSTR013373 [Laodelphax striatellus]
MESTKFMKKYLALLRLKEPRKSIPFFCYLIICFLTLRGIWEAIITEQDNDKALMTTSMMIGQITMIFLTIKNRVSPKNVMELINLVEEDFFVSRNDFVGRDNYGERIEQVNKQTERSMQITYQVIKLTVNIICWGFLLRNVTLYLLGIPIYSDNQSEPWLTPFLWRIKDDNIVPVAFFVYVYALHTIVIIMMHLEVYLVIATVVLSTERFLGDIDTFYQLLESFCQDFAGNEDKSVEENDSALMRGNLKRDMDRLVQCHQRITRNNKICNDNSAFMISAIILPITTDSCVNTYFLLKSNEVKKAVTSAITFLLINLCIFLFYLNGQRIFNQSEIVRKSLAELPWTDKPRWLRQTVLIMLTRANVDLEMRPYGIFVLNYMSFKDYMKFMFSVGNVLYSRKLATQ